MTHLQLVRHAETFWQTENRSPDRNDVGLTPLEHDFGQGEERCSGYLIYPFLENRSEQRFSIDFVYNFLKVYASIFDFLK